MKQEKGFTVIEIIFVIIILVGAGILFFTQRTSIEAPNRDSQAKTSVNAIYHHLEKIYYPTNNAYPENLTEESLPGIAPELLKDPTDIPIGNSDATLRYEPVNCENGKCKNYTLRALLEKEADFTKQSQH